MVFAYARDNLGTDFTIFLYMAIFATVVGLVALLKTLYQYCCVLEKGEPTSQYPINENPYAETGNVEMSNNML